ncbi:hypothetical protein MSAN_02000600 [Mycena sanguinolenta]|uniref:Uncharacterized protein n=1 Tax=Mycena sanguinolenta TaxID=230812 RepID=A0A8H6XM77_9AGAR|nr:hypothetical protein MSAN_02000600 [Mycena sanguinolenta]
MQFNFHLSALFIALAVGVVSATPVSVTARDVFDDCFNLGYEDGESSGCNAASGNNKARAVSERQLQCTGSLANAFNEGFNAGFNDGFNRLFISVVFGWAVVSIYVECILHGYKLSCYN